MNSVIKLSKAVNIAFEGVILIAQENGFYNVTKLAKETGCSKHHAAKVMQRLTKSGFIKSMRGPTGGFTLAMKPKNIKFIDLYEAVEGKIQRFPFPSDIGAKLLQSTFIKIETAFKNSLDRSIDRYI